MSGTPYTPQEAAIIEAKREFEQEQFRAKVELEKQRLILRKSIWVRLFPWKITVTRRDDPTLSRRQAQEQFKYYATKLGFRLRPYYEGNRPNDEFVLERK